MSVGSDSARSVDPADLTGGFAAGSIVAGKYCIERKLGAGGMGVVVAARHLQLNHLVAIKFLLDGGKGNTVNTARFLREARLAASLNSEHVARVTDLGTLESGDPFIVMEYLEGQSLSKYIKKTAPMLVEEAVGLMLQACDGLGEAHARGIVHRDVKPSNMFLTKKNDGSFQLKVLDFGISKAPLLEDGGEPTLTQSQMLLGTPQYLSPEQFADVRKVDHRTDIWALGVILYYMLSGRRPFKADTLAGLCLATATEQPKRLIELRPDLPPELDAVVMHCLEKDREMRVGSAAELASAIAPFGSGVSRVAVENIGIVPDSIRYAPPPPRALIPSNPKLMLSAAAVSSAAVSSAAGSSAMELAGPNLTLPGGDARVLLKPPDTQSGVLAVHAPATGQPATVAWPPILAALAIVGVLAAVFVSRQSSEPPQQLGGVVGVSPVAGTPNGDGSAKVPGQEVEESGYQPPERTIVVPGSARRATAKPEPKPTGPSLESKVPVAAGLVGTSQAQLRLLDRVGGQQVLGVVRKDEIVVVKRVVGEWILVTHINKGRAVTGWTLKNLVR